MGNNLPHFNVTAISYIVCTTKFKLKSIMSTYQESDIKKRPDMKITRIEFEYLLTECDIHESDRNLFLKFYTLLDVSGFEEVSILDILTCFCVILELPSIRDRIWTAIEMYSQGKCECTKDECLRLIKLMNNTCYYFGDKKLHDQQVHDLVDSVFTLAGKIDGCIPYEEVLTLLMHHPILEMFISLQFQGHNQTA